MRIGLLLLLSLILISCQGGAPATSPAPTGNPEGWEASDSAPGLDPFQEPLREGAGLLQGDISLNGTTETNPDYDTSPFPISQQAAAGQLAVFRVRGRLSNNANTTLFCKLSQTTKNYPSYFIPGTNTDTYRAIYVENNEPFNLTFYNATNYNTALNSKAALYNYSFKTSAAENADEPNDDDNGATITDRSLAKNIPKNFVATRSFYYFSETQRDIEEWYRLDVQAGQKFGWTFATTPGRYGSTWSYTMKVFDPSGVQMGNTVNIGTTEGVQGVSRDAVTTGTHYIQLVGTPVAKSYTNVFYSLYTLTPCIGASIVSVQRSKHCPGEEATWSIVTPDNLTIVHWDFGGACVPNSSIELNPTVINGDPGEYQGQLTVSNGCGIQTIPLSITVGCSGGAGIMTGGSAAVNYGDLALDDDDQTHLLGRLVGTADLDPGGLTTNVTMSGQGMFLSVLDNAGNLRQQIRIGGEAGTQITQARMAFHPSHGYRIAGVYSGTIDFNHGTGVAQKNSTTQGTNFLLALSPFRTFQYIATYTGNVTVAVPAIDPATGDTLLAGAFTGTVDFDPGVSVFSKTSAGGSDCFLMRYDFANRLINGQTWGAASSDSARSIAVGDTGVLLGGAFSDTVDFDPGPGTSFQTSTGTQAGFILELGNNPDLNFLKVRRDTGTGSSVQVTGVAYIESDGDFSGFCADFSGTASFGGTSLTSAGGTDVAVVYMNSTLSNIYARRVGGTGNDTAVALDVNPGPSNMVVIGEFRNTVDFDPGAGVDNRTAISGADAYVIELEEGGFLEYATTWGGFSNDSPKCVVVAPTGIARIGGTMGASTVDFEPGAGVTELTGVGITDAWLQRLLRNGLWQE